MFVQIDENGNIIKSISAGALQTLYPNISFNPQAAVLQLGEENYAFVTDEPPSVPSGQALVAGSIMKQNDGTYAQIYSLRDQTSGETQNAEEVAAIQARTIKQNQIRGENPDLILTLIETLNLIVQNGHITVSDKMNAIFAQIAS